MHNQTCALPPLLALLCRWGLLVVLVVGSTGVVQLLLVYLEAALVYVETCIA